jgi:hypothetical protein
MCRRREDIMISNCSIRQSSNMRSNIVINYACSSRASEFPRYRSRCSCSQQQHRQQLKNSPSISRRMVNATFPKFRQSILLSVALVVMLSLSIVPSSSSLPLATSTDPYDDIVSFSNDLEPLSLHHHDSTTHSEQLEQPRRTVESDTTTLKGIKEFIIDLADGDGTSSVDSNEKKMTHDEQEKMAEMITGYNQDDNEKNRQGDGLRQRLNNFVRERFPHKLDDLEDDPYELLGMSMVTDVPTKTATPKSPVVSPSTPTRPTRAPKPSATTPTKPTVPSPSKPTPTKPTAPSPSSPLKPTRAPVPRKPTATTPSAKTSEPTVSGDLPLDSVVPAPSSEVSDVPSDAPTGLIESALPTLITSIQPTKDNQQSKPEPTSKPTRTNTTTPTIVSPSAASPVASPLSLKSDVPTIIKLTPSISPVAQPNRQPVVRPNRQPNAQPSAVTVSPTDEANDGCESLSRNEAMLQVLSNITDEELLLNSVTPQGLAFLWLVEEDQLQLDPCTPSQLAIQQRYALVVLYCKYLDFLYSTKNT